MRQAQLTAGPQGLGRQVFRVVDAPALADEWRPELRFLVLPTTGTDARRLQATTAQLGNAWPIQSNELQAGDVVVPTAGGTKLTVLLRESDEHHALFLTNRCNSRCLMCSQPPTAHDDGWLVQEAIDAVRHIRQAPVNLGITGGEPLLLGPQLRQLLDVIHQQLPHTAVDLLTNARLLADPALAHGLLQGLATPVRWLVPLYGAADFVHDHVVQAPGAYEQTLAGLLMLQEHGQAIQLRIVLIQPVLEQLPTLCEFIGRNLPFVQEVALMACEPTGYALANRELCEVDLQHWRPTLQAATQALRRHRIPFVLMNTPLCAIDPALWPQARRSISDWKQTYAPACQGCAVRGDCAGLFAWHARGWAPAPVRAITQEEQATWEEQAT